MGSRREAAEKAIALGQADVLAGRVTPHEAVARTAGALPTGPADTIAERAVVWSDAARTTYLATIETLLGNDPEEAHALAVDLARGADQLGYTPEAVEGRVASTWEKAVPQTAYVLVFELVTWAKAGEVVAIDALLDEPGDSSREVPIWSRDA